MPRYASTVDFLYTTLREAAEEAGAFITDADDGDLLALAGRMAAHPGSAVEETWAEVEAAAAPLASDAQA